MLLMQKRGPRTHYDRLLQEKLSRSGVCYDHKFANDSLLSKHLAMSVPSKVLASPLTPLNQCMAQALKRHRLFMQQVLAAWCGVSTCRQDEKLTRLRLCAVLRHGLPIAASCLAGAHRVCLSMATALRVLAT